MKFLKQAWEVRAARPALGCAASLAPNVARLCRRLAAWRVQGTTLPLVALPSSTI
jgi:hypothetical protein